MPRTSDLLPTITDCLGVIRSEYLEDPGLRLTKTEIARRWGLDTLMCDALIEALVDVRFLRRTHAGLYLRNTTSQVVCQRTSV